MTNSPPLFARAFSRFRFPVIALQWGGNLLAMLLAALWLQIPDSHAWQFAFSMISAAAILVGFCWLQVLTFARVRPTPQPATLWLRISPRILGFTLVATLWILLAQWISSGSDSIPNYAYLWNSKLSPGMRITFSPTRIIATLSFLLELLVGVVTALLLPIAITLSTEGLRRPSWRDARRPYRRILYWVAVLAFCILTTQLTSALASWTLGKGVSGQVISVALRLAVAYATDIVLWCLLLAFSAAWMDSAPGSTLAPEPLPDPAPAPAPAP
jgi:hypothetical protein